MTAYPPWEVLKMVLSPLRKSQQKILTLVVQAIAAMAQAASLPLAAFLAQVTGSQLDSALVRFYRLLHNRRLEDEVITRQLLSFLASAYQPLLIAIDWTEWHSDLRMLLASVVVGARAIPVQVAVFSKTDMPRSQNTRENTFLRLLSLNLRELKIPACFLADRGFRRVSFLKLLLGQAGNSFVVRVCDKLIAQTPRGPRLLQKCGLQPGYALDLGFVQLRQDGAVTVRVVGFWAKGQKEPWWLATNLAEPLSQLASLYDRRMAIEEQIRDTKGARFGLQLVCTQIRTPQALARFTLLIGLALLLLTAVGQAVALKQPRVRLPSKKKGPRLSLVTVGRLFLNHFLSQHSFTAEILRQNIPPPRLRHFPELLSIQPLLI